MTTPLPPRQTPSLRIAEMAITNFRTFRERTVIPFSGGGQADALATFHGGNGAGKSNALAALDLFFRTASVSIATGGHAVPWDALLHTPFGPLQVLLRDRPFGSVEPTSVEVEFEDARLGRLCTFFTPAGDRAHLETQQMSGGQLVPPEHRVRDWLASPLGPGSRPLAILDARRRPVWLGAGSPAHGAALVEALFNLRTSLRVDERERWRTFAALLEQFPMFQGKDISIDRVRANEPPELFFEDRGRSVLRLTDLSSGEQQLVLLCATILVANASIVAVEEPELSVDFKNQALLGDILRRQIDAGLVDQIILESHVPSFDGPSVIRFDRAPGGATQVTREETPVSASTALSEQARAQGAVQRWVTSDGYTQLPEAMRGDLQTGAGKHVWFLKGPERWEAWPEDELEQMLGGGEADDD